MSHTAPASPGSPQPLRTMSDSQNYLPVTPQRINRLHKLRAASSPLTPLNSRKISTPFTPITNLYSPASSITTPSSVSSGTRVDSSPESTKKRDTKSGADAVANWRARAQENGIKVTAHDSDDDSKDQTESLPASFLSTHRRSRQAQFQSKSSDITSLTSPRAARVPVSESGSDFTPSPRKILSALNTPSPRTSSAIVQKLKLRGSLTDPAQTRRRPAFGAPLSEALFDIDENVNEYSPYSQSFGSPISLSRPSRIRSASEACAPGLGDGDVNPFLLPRQNTFLHVPFSPARPSKANVYEPVAKSSLSTETSNAPKTCSVCSSSTSALSVLLPCQHLICSSCLTGALNIVGEKDMRCAVCECLVKDFKMLVPLSRVLKDDDDQEDVKTSSPAATSFAEFKASFEIRNDAVPTTRMRSPDAQTHVVASNGTQLIDGELAVLRIDNVPWDITPPALSAFFEPYAITSAHVLLEPRGKTLSHAYVELASTQARAALRSVQNKTMGKGKRMRGVTVTMSSQGELMRALFPNWKGTFDASRPSLNGLDNDRIVKALEYGLISLNELDALITLMRNPDSHFLKVPSLPFYSLVSILSKFPTDCDSRVFWSSTLRDLLHEMTFAATQMIVSRIAGPQQDQYLLEKLVKAGVNCQAFTDQQRLKLMDLVDAHIPSLLQSMRILSAASPAPPSTTCGSSISRSEAVRTPDDHAQSQYTAYAFHHPGAIYMSPMAVHAPFVEGPRSPYNVLAREFGVEPDLVHALAQRLSMAGQSGYGSGYGM